MKKLLVVFCSLLISLSLSAQEEDPPPIRWVRYYQAQDFAGAPSFFNDVFTMPDGGYACSGRVHTANNDFQGWMLVTGENGDVVHDIMFDYPDNEVARTQGYCVMKTDDDGYLMGGRTQIGDQIQMNFDVMKVDQDGEVEWWEIYSEGDNGWGCHDLIELGEGNYVAAGQCTDYHAFAVMIDNDGDIIWENVYEGRWLFGVQEVAGEGLVFAGYAQEAPLIMKTDYDGEVIWRRTYEGGALWNLVSLPNGGFAASGQATRRQGFLLIKVNDEGIQQWIRNYPLLDGGGTAFGLAVMPDGGMVMSGHTTSQGYYSAVVRVDAAGNLRWQRINDELPNGQFEDGVAREYGKVTVEPDGTIMICGNSQRTVENDEVLSEGVLVCFESDRSPPTIVEWSPEPLEFDVQIEDTVTFTVRVEDLQNDSIHYLWILNSDTLAADTVVALIFEELGTDTVHCLVSDGNQADSLTWEITVIPNAVDAKDLSQLPTIPTLYAASPNPFNSQTTVKYFLPTAAQVDLDLFDINGRLVKELVNQRENVGYHSVFVNGSDLVSGVYFVKMTVEREMSMRKIVLIK